MRYEDLLILIPSHSLEDFPTELSEEDASSLLNAFAVSWHPKLLASARVLPRWHRADDPPEGSGRRLVFIPTSCDSWVTPGWVERVQADGAIVVRGTGDRQQMIDRAVLPLEDHRNVDPGLVADFLALGSCSLQIELLTRKMRHFSSLDEVYLQREATGAAEAALAGDIAAAKTRLGHCFEILTDARQRFYGVDCYLLDLCLFNPTGPVADLMNLLGAAGADPAAILAGTAAVGGTPFSLMLNAGELDGLAKSDPDCIARLKEAVAAGTSELICGSWGEPPLSMLPNNSQLWHLEQSQALCRKLVERVSPIWATRRFGLSPALPLWLKRAGYQGALHVALDDGIYPDFEYSKFRWEGVDNSVIEAFSRIPLAGDTATSFLRFADRMSESMDNDQTAAIAFARWPDLRSPFLNDFRRMHAYSPVLGKFATFGEFFERTEFPSRSGTYRPREYLSPFFVQMAAREERDAVSRFQGWHQRRQRFDTARWLHLLTGALRGQRDLPAFQTELERELETLPEPATSDQIHALNQKLQQAVTEQGQKLAALITGPAPQEPGYLVINPLSFARTVAVTLPDDGPRPDESRLPRLSRPQPTGEGAIAPVALPSLQWTDTRRLLTADLPACGFVWIPAEPGAAVNDPAAANAMAANRSRTSDKSVGKSSRSGSGSGVPLAEPDLLRNDTFEVRLNPLTGGILHIKNYGRSPNRLSQQLSYRFARERTFVIARGDESEEFRSHYAEMRRLSSEVTSTGPVLGEIVTHGEIYDQKNAHALAGFTQTVRIWRGLPLVELEITLNPQHMPETEAWHSYYGARFAWHDSSAALTRSAFGGAHETSEERLESPHFLEIATTDMRTTILPCGLPYHRKTGPRMLDSILISHGETERTFRFVIALDQSYPMAAALDAMVPPVVIPVQRAGSAEGNPGNKVSAAGRPTPPSGWFLHLDARSVQLLDLLPLVPEPPQSFGSWHRPEPAAAGAQVGVTVRLMETEGRPVQFRLSAFRTPVRARQRDLLGKTIAELPIEGEAVILSLSGHEMADVELIFQTG